MEYPIDPSESSQPTASEPKERRSTNLIFSGLKILVTGVAIPVVVSILTSYYVNTRLLKPRLRADYSSAQVMVMTDNNRPNEFIAALVDFYGGFRATLPPGTSSREEVDKLDKPLAFTGGEIATAKRLKFKSAHDYTIDPFFQQSSQIMKIMLVNDGYTTANHIDIGLQLEDLINHKIVPSPNIHISESAVAGSGVNPSFVKITIDRLGASEKALLTVVTSRTDSSPPSPVNSPFLQIHRNFPRSETGPILYLSSDEGSGTISSDGISWKDATSWEEASFPNSVIGFWASHIHPRKGISPSIEDMKELEIPYELVGEGGKRTGTGTWKMSPNH